MVTVALALLLVASAFTSAVDLQPREAETLERVRRIGACAIREGDGGMRLDEAFRTKLRAEVAGHEREVVDFCIRYELNIPDREDEYTDALRYLCQGLWAVLDVMQEETLEGFRRALGVADGEVPLRVRVRLKAWICTTSLVEGFRFGVDHLIGDTTELKSRGEPAPGWNDRICDRVYNTVTDRLEAGTPFSGARHLLVSDPLPERDRRIKEMKAWWDTNKQYLVWNADTRSFGIAPQAPVTKDTPK